MELLYYNCRGLSNKECLYEFETTLDKIKWDIVDISEEKTGGGIDKIKNGNYFLFWGVRWDTEAIEDDVMVDL